MNIINEWLEKSKKDLSTAIRENSIKNEPNFDAVCFHSQQCIEKALKALMIKMEISISKIHDLNYLYLQIKQHNQSIFLDEYKLRYLSRAAVAFRYPGEDADFEQATTSLNFATEIFKQIHEYLGNE